MGFCSSSLNHQWCLPYFCVDYAKRPQYAHKQPIPGHLPPPTKKPFSEPRTSFSKPPQGEKSPTLPPRVGPKPLIAPTLPPKVGLAPAVHKPPVEKSAPEQKPSAPWPKPPIPLPLHKPPTLPFPKPSPPYGHYPGHYPPMKKSWWASQATP